MFLCTSFHVYLFSQGSQYSITTCKNEPSGFTESKLTKEKMSLADTGTYQCSDDDNSYSVWVQALQGKHVDKFDYTQALNARSLRALNSPRPPKVVMLP